MNNLEDISKRVIEEFERQQYKLKMTDKEFASYIKMSERTYNNWKNRNIKKLDFAQVITSLGILGIKPFELLNIKDTETYVASPENHVKEQQEMKQMLDKLFSKVENMESNQRMMMNNQELLMSDFGNVKAEITFLRNRITNGKDITEEERQELEQLTQKVIEIGGNNNLES